VQEEGGEKLEEVMAKVKEARVKVERWAEVVARSGKIFFITINHYKNNNFLINFLIPVYYFCSQGSGSTWHPW